MQNVSIETLFSIILDIDPAMYIYRPYNSWHLSFSQAPWVTWLYNRTTNVILPLHHTGETRVRGQQGKACENATGEAWLHPPLSKE